MRAFTDPDGETLDMKAERNMPQEDRLENARRRLSEEKASGCASPEDIAYWKSVIMDLGGEG